MVSCSQDKQVFPCIYIYRYIGKILRGQWPASFPIRASPSRKAAWPVMAAHVHHWGAKSDSTSPPLMDFLLYPETPEPLNSRFPYFSGTLVYHLHRVSKQTNKATKIYILSSVWRSCTVFVFHVHGCMASPRVYTGYYASFHPFLIFRRWKKSKW